jgi:hypothetical protein
MDGELVGDLHGKELDGTSLWLVISWRGGGGAMARWLCVDSLILLTVHVTQLAGAH